jgi:hypothetical protein
VSSESIFTSSPSYSARRHRSEGSSRARGWVLNLTVVRNLSYWHPSLQCTWPSRASWLLEATDDPDSEIDGRFGGCQHQHSRDSRVPEWSVGRLQLEGRRWSSSSSRSPSAAVGSLCDPVWLSATASCILEPEKVASAQTSAPY